MTLYVVGYCLIPPPFDWAGRFYTVWVSLGLLGCMLGTGFDKKRRRLWALCLLMLAPTPPPAACGGGSSTLPPPVAQSCTVTVTATSGALQHSTQVIVTVN